MQSSNAVDVRVFLDEHPFSSFQWIVFGLCFVVVLLDGFDTAAIGFVAPSLLKEWGVEKSALGPVLSAALFGLAAGALWTARRSYWPQVHAGRFCAGFRRSLLRIGPLR